MQEMLFAEVAQSCGGRRQKSLVDIKTNDFRRIQQLCDLRIGKHVIMVFEVPFQFAEGDAAFVKQRFKLHIIKVIHSIPLLIHKKTGRKTISVSGHSCLGTFRNFNFVVPDCP